MIETGYPHASLNIMGNPLINRPENSDKLPEIELETPPSSSSFLK